MNETGNETMTDNTAVDGQENGVQTDNQSGGAPAAGNETTNGTLIDTNWTIDAKALDGMNIESGFVDSYTGLAKKVRSESGKRHVAPERRCRNPEPDGR